MKEKTSKFHQVKHLDTNITIWYPTGCSLAFLSVEIYIKKHIQLWNTSRISMRHWGCLKYRYVTFKTNCLFDNTFIYKACKYSYDFMPQKLAVLELFSMQ